MKKKLLIGSGFLATFGAILGTLGAFSDSIVAFRIISVAWIWASLGLVVFIIGLAYPKE